MFIVGKVLGLEHGMTLNSLSGLEFSSTKPRSSTSWSLLLLGGLQLSKTNENRKVLLNNKEIINQTRVATKKRQELRKCRLPSK
jgi:hypothetical protein